MVVLKILSLTRSWPQHGERKDGQMPKSKQIKASDFKCCSCKKEQAVAFWPCIDPDIQSHPYCRKCLDAAQTELMIQIAELDFGRKRDKGT